MKQQEQPARASRTNRPLVLIRGGGDLATGAVARLHRTGFGVVVLEAPQPRAIRRLVALAEAVYAGRAEIEDLHGVHCADVEAARSALAEGLIPVLVDPQADSLAAFQPVALVDARMRKSPPELGLGAAPFVVGLGPGFTAGVDCHAVVETQRGHHLGRVLWQGQAAPDSGVPEAVAGHDRDRVLRAPAAGVLEALVRLGAVVRAGDVIARIGGVPLRAPFDGALRGLLHDGLEVVRGEKVGDLDPRGVPAYCREISDKSLAVGGGVLEALLSQPEIRRRLGS